MEVPVTWHAIKFPCPTHGTETSLYEILAHSGGEILVKGFCEECDKQGAESTHIFKTDIQRILVHCAVSDVRDQMCKQKMLEGGTNGNVSGQIELSDFDKGFLAEAHIEPQEGA